jgi:N-carbamoylputrescine amidase
VGEKTGGFAIGLVQRVADPDPEANLEGTLAAMRRAADAGAQVICTQELFRTPYFCQTEDPARFDLAEAIPGPTSEAMAALAREKGVAVIASLFERRSAGVYHNTAAILDADGSLAGTYRKMHIPDDPLYHEKFYFTPGDEGFKTFSTRFGRVGVLICWDQWYPEAARLTALRGAEVIFYPTAIGWHPAEKEEWGVAQHDAWRTAQRAHAIANGVYVAAVNRVGHERLTGDGIQFWGGSFVADPLGRVVAESPQDGEDLLLARVDRGLVEEIRRNWPFLRDRRIDAYAGLDRRLLD